MNPALVILNPRQIPECIQAFQALEISRIWLKNYTELQLNDVFPRIVEENGYGHGFSHFIAVSDDVVVTQEALDRVLALLKKHPVATGYCNLDETDNAQLVNLTKTPLRNPVPSLDMYDFWRRDELPKRITTFFAGMCLTGMSRDMWMRFPFRAYRMGGRGCCSDYNLSWRLQQAGVPIVSDRDAFCQHLKRRWNEQDPERRLEFGEKSVTVD